VAPNPDDVFAALRLCPDPAAVRVILLGQDPYHSITETGPIANGLAFSVNASIRKLPPSLANIYKELASDVGPLPPGTSGDLSVWAKQGVLLLNDVLTVSIGAPLSHQGIGWEQLTQQILLKILTAAPHVVIVAWGRNAQKKLEAAPIAAILERHTVLKAPHPSPLSAHTGFFGSKPFSQANAALQTHGQPPIVWT
jgi:uracil-DNA glycosylase